ncbi:hypothetical protein LV779_08075 [Streptomyces thinghirensis]|nr:hypothetical protein [Streptomyces thinghirensis]
MPEIKELLLLLGAEIEELPGRSECLDPTDTDDPLTHFHRTLSEPGSTYLHTDQYFNPRNVEGARGGHRAGDSQGPGRAGAGLVRGLRGHGRFVDRCRQVLREHDPEVRVLGLVAHKSDFIPGIRTIDEVHQVGLFDPATYDTIESVTSGEAIDGMLTLIRRADC